ncbi:MAG: restriction endonuclease, SacI family [Pyrinomonadaceae bacterium]|nr:restriction endonuclease, SacI family [Pyrinomonadaceae bacterium]
MSPTPPTRTPASILDLAYERASSDPSRPIINNPEIVERVQYVCRFLQNKVGRRFLLACALAKTHNPDLDIRKPYTGIGTPDSYSGRRYDESHVKKFVIKYDLPVNASTAFLTPAFRNRNATLTTDFDLVGDYPTLYEKILLLLDDVQSGRISAEDLLAEVVRWLIIIRDEQRQRIDTLLAGLRTVAGAIPLSSEAIVNLIQQHLGCRNSSRLPVLVVTAAYNAASERLGERALPLSDHHGADIQTGSLGDVEITLANDDNVITCYEMKDKRVEMSDISDALRKITDRGDRIDNYIFITTEEIDREVVEYAASIYEQTGVVEVVVLNCIGFLRHFLHLFHRLRTRFLEEYQRLVLDEPESAVGQPLKEAFLALRQAAESKE